MKPGQVVTIPYRAGDSDQDALVFVPERYSPLYKYGLLLLFDGLDYWRQGRLSRVIEETFGQRLPFLIALLPISAALRDSVYHPMGNQHSMFLHAISGSLVRTLEAQYSLVPLRSARSIGGSSLGGTMALSLAAHYPRRFGSLHLQSPACDDRSATWLASLPAGTFSGIDIQITVGEQEKNTPLPPTSERTQQEGEPRTRDFFSEALSCQRQLALLGGSVDLHSRQGGHGWDAWQQDLPQLLQSFASSLWLSEERD